MLHYGLQSAVEKDSGGLLYNCTSIGLETGEITRTDEYLRLLQTFETKIMNHFLESRNE